MRMTTRNTSNKEKHAEEMIIGFCNFLKAPKSNKMEKQSLSQRNYYDVYVISKQHMQTKT
jgi:hypothetical protein